MSESHLTSSDLTFEELQRLCRIAAKVVAMFGDTYLPIFERLHIELQTRQKKQDLKTLALTYAQSSL